MPEKRSQSNAWMWVGKLTPPQMKLDTVQRDGLLKRLVQTQHVPLSLIISPAGFGKTTLLAQLHALYQRAGGPAAGATTQAAWLTLDEGDRDEGSFLAYVLLAIERAGIDLGPLVRRAHEQTLEADPMRTVSALLQAVQRAQRRVTLMLDDYHRATSPGVDEIVRMLLERGTPWLRIVIASRARPNWALATMKACGLLHEVHPSELVLSLSETTTMLGGGVDSFEASIIHSRTEGWAVAIQLARLWVSEGPGSSHGLQAFSGRVTEVADYLTEQVIAKLPEDCRQFLVETSMFERFNAELADVARGRTDSAEILARLSGIDSLLVPLDAARTWFRYHQLFADFLRPRLSKPRAREIHRAAAPWLAEQEDWSLAVAHALLAGDVRLAVSFIEKAGGWKLVLHMGIQYTRRLLERFDDLARRSEPQLLLIQAYLHAKHGDELLAFEMLRLAKAGLEREPSASAEHDMVVIEALVHSYFDHLEVSKSWPRTGEAANRYLPDDPLGQATLLCVSAVSAVALGHMAEAIEAARAARTRMRLVRSPLGENFCLLHESQALSVMGRLEQGRMMVDEAVSLAEANFGTDSSMKALVGCFKAQQLFWEGRWSEAQPLIQSVQDSLLRVDGWLDVFAVMAEVAWRIAVRNDGCAQAMSILDETALLARRRNMPRLERMAMVWRIDLLAQSGMAAQARKEAANAGLDKDLTNELAAEQPDWRFLEAASLALARMHLAGGAPSVGQARLKRAAKILQGMGLELPAWRVNLMSLLLDQRTRGHGAGEGDAESALTPILEHGLHGFLMELGQQVVPVVQQLAGPLSAQLQSALQKVNNSGSSAQARPQRRAQCSAKEMEVLNLLVAGQPNKLIARTMGISADTVKFHLKQIYRKLGVDNRSAAVTVAIRQGLVTAEAIPVGAQE
ncbi:LuxR C-terminal-related transcriptional regulator [Paucibacter sp. R3-3]|uniref:LuxR C-terminal-related transcriptional regulator n=1 Tax=Roseateles agri TaxID=3098619 RepID=A0ABU5DG84_9BURK|nr:LuxR C-terminal-related transcriptional regulator [Paucibacter sp. R3-3]MDY0745292.1 LuxR C-terminal-related transcriptional regulator [Paucibacter sp. R3-3]